MKNRCSTQEEEKYALVLLIDPKVTKNIKEAIIQFVFLKNDFRNF